MPIGFRLIHNLILIFGFLIIQTSKSEPHFGGKLNSRNCYSINVHSCSIHIHVPIGNESMHMYTHSNFIISHIAANVWFSPSNGLLQCSLGFILWFRVFSKPLKLNLSLKTHQNVNGFLFFPIRRDKALHVNDFQKSSSVPTTKCQAVIDFAPRWWMLNINIIALIIFIFWAIAIASMLLVDERIRKRGDNNRK